MSNYVLSPNIWGYDENPATRTVDNFIVKLRNRIEKDPNHPQSPDSVELIPLRLGFNESVGLYEIILNVHGIGYKLVS